MNTITVRDRYKTHDNAVISSPGKFEGEMIYVPYLWEQSAFNPEEFEITDEDRKLFPEIPAETKTIYLYENDDGFVSEISEEQFRAIEEERDNEGAF